MEEIQNSIHKNLFNKKREYDMRGIMIPCIGDILYYDTIDKQAIIQEVGDDRFINLSFIPIGIIADISTDCKTLKLITPYLIKVSFDMNEKISEKNIIKELKSFVRSYTKQLFNEELDDMKFNMATADDLQLLIDNSDKVLNGIGYFNNINIPKDKDIQEIISNDIIVFDNKKSLEFTYSLKDNYNIDKTISDIRLENRNDTWNNIKTWKDIKDSQVETLDCYIIPIATITLD